ncbi:MAG: hypothetical protein ACD_62C00225G0001 [uncultured bacterium]|nr:MAG: hypothetical protein ACD_62C00225G0001 [uncultured bacterium]
MLRVSQLFFTVFPPPPAVGMPSKPQQTSGESVPEVQAPVRLKKIYHAVTSARPALRAAAQAFASRMHAPAKLAGTQPVGGDMVDKTGVRQQPGPVDKSSVRPALASTVSEQDMLAGLEVMRQLYGAEFARTVANRLEELSSKFHRVAVGVAYAMFWSDPVLSTREKSLVTIAALVAQGKEEQTRIHMRGFLESGGTVVELEAALLHLAIYCGFPAAMNALNQLMTIRGELEKKGKAAPIVK